MKNFLAKANFLETRPESEKQELSIMFELLSPVEDELDKECVYFTSYEISELFRKHPVPYSRLKQMCAWLKDYVFWHKENCLKDKTRTYANYMKYANSVPKAETLVVNSEAIYTPDEMQELVDSLICIYDKLYVQATYEGLWSYNTNVDMLNLNRASCLEEQNMVRLSNGKMFPVSSKLMQLLIQGSETLTYQQKNRYGVTTIKVDQRILERDPTLCFKKKYIDTTKSKSAISDSMNSYRQNIREKQGIPPNLEEKFVEKTIRISGLINAMIERGVSPEEIGTYTILKDPRVREVTARYGIKNTKKETHLRTFGNFLKSVD